MLIPEGKEGKKEMRGRLEEEKKKREVEEGK